MNKIQNGFLEGCYYVDDYFITGQLKVGQDEAIIKNVKEGDVCIDIGSNCGYYTLMLSKLVGEKGKVYSFEPVNPTYNKLIEVLKANNVMNVSAHRYAIGDDVKDVKIIYQEAGDLDACVKDKGIYMPIVFGRECKLKEEYMIMITLDAFVHSMVDIDRIDFIKIDTQGCDLDILKSSRGLILYYEPKILCEGINNEKTKLILEFFNSINYYATVVEDSYHYGDDKTVHILAYKK